MGWSNDELEGIWKEMLVFSFKIRFRDSPLGAEEVNENLRQGSRVFRSGYKPEPLK